MGIRGLHIGPLDDVWACSPRERRRRYLHSVVGGAGEAGAAFRALLEVGLSSGLLFWTVWRPWVCWKP